MRKILAFTFALIAALNGQAQSGGRLAAPAYYRTVTPNQMSGVLAWYTSGLGTLNAISPDTPATDAQSIRRWLDSSYSGTNADQTTSGARPQLDTSRSTVTQFVNNFMGMSANVVFSGQAFSAFFISKPETLNKTFSESSYQDYHVWLNTNGSLTFQLYYDGAAGKLGYHTSGYTTGSLKANTSINLMGAIGSASSLRLIFNNTEETQTALSSSSTSSVNIGGTATDFPVMAAWSDVIIFDHALSASELAQVRAYATTRGVSYTATNFLGFAGDSISTGSIAPQNKDWIYQSGLGGLQFNVSIGGQTLATIASDNRLSAYYDGTKRCVAVVFAGTNDIALNGRTGAQVEADLNTYCTTLRSQGWKVVVVTMLPRSGLETQRQAYNNAIRANASGYSDAVADVETLSMGAANANTDTTWYDADQIHPNTTGHGFLAGLIGPLVQALMVAP